MPARPNAAVPAGDVKPRQGFHLLGFLTGGFGVGEAARHTLRRMNHLGIPVTAKDVELSDHRQGQVKEFEAQFETRCKHWPGKINLFHINPPEVEQVVIHQFPGMPLTNCLNVIVPFWELPSLPPTWLPCLKSMDCILAPSRFIRDIILRHFPEKTVIDYPQAVPIADPAQPDRPGFGLPEDEFILLCAFDAMSCVERKNPWAAITAFQKAFPSSEKARLVIKASNTQESDTLERLHKATQNDPRISMLTERLSHQRLQSLYASCDALVSLHRSEGLGLFIMEMMAQAKPAIVTAWSGNMDFTTSSNSCLVSASMVPVHSEHPAYEYANNQQDTCWAEADTDEAAAWMRKLVGQPQLGAQIGREARSTMLKLASLNCTKVFETLEEQARTGLKRKKTNPQHFIKLRRHHLRKRIERAIKGLIRGKDYRNRKKAAKS